MLHPETRKGEWEQVAWRTELSLFFRTSGVWF